MPKQKKKIHEQALERFKRADEGWADIYDQALDDLRFVYDVDGGQWPDDIRRDRKGRPMLTINKLLKFVRQLRGEQRMNRPRIRVIPVDSKADVVRARLMDGIIRQIEYLSDANIVYDTAYMHSVSASIGYFRLITQYADPDSFDQDIYLKRIANPFSVHFDPAATEFNLSDARYCFIDEWLSRNEFEDKYPRADMSHVEASVRGQHYTKWFEDERVRIAEYFWKETEQFKLLMVEQIDPNTGLKRQFTTRLTEEIKQQLEEGELSLLRERTSSEEVIKWVKISGSEVLEGPKTWIGKYIPVIPVFGDEIIVNGKRYLLSLIRNAKDAQRMYNYWSSSATETVALAPKSPYIVEHRQIKGFEQEWQEANIRNRMYLRYKYVPGLQKPQRERQTEVPSAIVSMMQTTHFDLEDILGRYESAKGAPSNERSGKAIQVRVAQSDKGTFAFVDNFTRAIVYTGKQLIDLIPKIYDTHRAITIMGEDGNQQQVEINRPTGQMTPDGQPVIENDLTVGKYDVVATAGASFSTLRQEMVNMMIQSMQYAPQVAPLIAPLIFKYSDWPGADEIAQRLEQAIQQQEQMAQLQKPPTPSRYQ